MIMSVAIMSAAPCSRDGPAETLHPLSAEAGAACALAGRSSQRPSRQTRPEAQSPSVAQVFKQPTSGRHANGAQLSRSPFEVSAVAASMQRIDGATHAPVACWQTNPGAQS
jgi:hypothetical protein